MIIQSFIGVCMAFNCFKKNLIYHLVALRLSPSLMFAQVLTFSQTSLTLMLPTWPTVK